MGSAESVVHVHVERLGEVLHERSLVLLFLRVEAGVFEDDELAFLALFHGFVHRHAHAIGRELHFRANVLAHAHGARGEGGLGVVAVLRAAQVGACRHLGAGLKEILKGRHRRADAGVVGDLAGFLVERHVQVAPHQDFLALEVFLLQVRHGLLGLERHCRAHGRGHPATRRGESLGAGEERCIDGKVGRRSGGGEAKRSDKVFFKDVSHEVTNEPTPTPPIRLS